MKRLIKKLVKLFLLAAFCLPLATAVYAEPPKRIISLAPSMTEILFALGLEDYIVGVTSYCDYPENAKKKPKIGGMSNPSLEAVVSLKPDIVVMTTDGNPKEFEERLRSLKIKTYVSRSRRISELPQGIREIGAVLGVKERAEMLAKEIEAAINKFRGQKSSPPPPPPVKGGTKGGLFSELRTLASGESPRRPNSELESFSKKKILFIVWPEPLIVAGTGTAIDDAINLLQHENIASKAKSVYPKYSIEEVMRQSPDVIFIGRQMGLDIGEVSQGFLKKVAGVPAVKNGKIFYVSDSLYRLGPRVIKGIEELAECLK